MGKESVFRTDIMDMINPYVELEDVKDMVQVNDRLLICSGDAGRIYNLDSRTFDIEGMTSFKETYPDCSFVSFALGFLLLIICILFQEIGEDMCMITCWTN